MSSIIPSIGRKVWFWNASLFEMTVVDSKQAIDATVIFVNPDGTVNLATCDHAGNSDVKLGVPLIDPGNAGHEHGSGVSYATWMPYQVGVTKRADELNAAQAAASKDASTPAPPSPAP